jgi:hypothetical protein
MKDILGLTRESECKYFALNASLEARIDSAYENLKSHFESCLRVEEAPVNYQSIVRDLHCLEGLQWMDKEGKCKGYFEECL